MSQPTTLVNVHACMEHPAGALQHEYLHTVRLQTGLATCMALGFVAAAPSPALLLVGTSSGSLHTLLLKGGPAQASGEQGSTGSSRMIEGLVVGCEELEEESDEEESDEAEELSSLEDVSVSGEDGSQG